jgi:hypothetical protein
MSGFSPLAARPATPSRATAAELLRRKPRRVTVTISWQTYQRLQERADLEGRSFSNLASYLLERGLT